MTKREKRLQRIRQNPKNVTFDEIKQVLEDYGFEHVRTNGSHHTFIAIIGESNWRLTIPLNRPIKFPYIKKSLEAIDEISLIQAEFENVEEEQDGNIDD